MPRGVDITIFADDNDPELVRGVVVTPVSRSAKTFLSWLGELLNLDEIIVERSSGKKITAYWTELARADDLVESLSNTEFIIQYSYPS